MSLVVETGQALLDSDTYISKVEADTYIHDYTDYSNWASLDTTSKERWLRRATQRLDAQYNYFWKDGSTKVKDNQSLQWPRFGARDNEGFAIDSNEIPTVVKQAVAELAGLFADSGDTIATTATTGILEEFVKIGDLEERVKYAGSKNVTELAPRVVEILSKNLGSYSSGDIFLKRC